MQPLGEGRRVAWSFSLSTRTMPRSWQICWFSIISSCPWYFSMSSRKFSSVRVPSRYCCSMPGTDPLVDEVHLTERLEGLLEGLRVPERQIQGVVHLLHQLVVLLVEDELRDGRPCIHLDTVHVLDNLRVPM